MRGYPFGKLEEPKLVLFDMDGILFDTMPTHARSWKQAADRYGLIAKESDFYLYEGMKGTQTIQELYRKSYGREPSEEIVKEVYSYKTECFIAEQARQEEELPLIPGAKEMVAFLSEMRGCKIGVVTGSIKENALARIKKHYSEYIHLDHIVTADVVEQGKPHPEPYLKGMELCGHTPEETLIVENAPLGVRSGIASGALVMTIMTGPIPERRFREEGTHYALPDMKSFYLWWQEHFCK